MNIQFLQPAVSEIDEAVTFYEREGPGLDRLFLDDLFRALKAISAFPSAWHPMSERTRRCRLRRFPYGVIYQVRNDGILVVAVAHLHRKPDDWKDRIR